MLVCGFSSLTLGLALAGDAIAEQSAKVVITVGVPAKVMSNPPVSLKSVVFSELPGWENDDHLSAWKAFVISCPAVLKLAKSKSASRSVPPELAEVCGVALDISRSGIKMSGVKARAFFEGNFVPQAVEQRLSSGLLTGYYEPLIKASRKQDEAYRTPVYRRPLDLVNVVAESERGAKSLQLTHMRQTAEGLKPFLTRAEIEKGGLNGQGLELLYFRDPVDVYFLQVQGSGRIELPSGERIRITYDGKNGYPYTSIGRELIQAGMFSPDNMSLKALAGWLKANRKRAEPVLWKNESYVFFRELTANDGDGPLGALGSGLSNGRSLAIDTAYHALGTPIYVSAPQITHASPKGEGFNRLMIAQDVGSAIKGPERGDIFFGSGHKAGRVAGVTKHPGRFFVLTPNPAPDAKEAAARLRP